MIAFNYSEIYFPLKDEIGYPWYELDWLELQLEELIAVDLIIRTVNSDNRISNLFVFPEVALLGSAFNICFELVQIIKMNEERTAALCDARYYLYMELMEDKTLKLSSYTILSPPTTESGYFKKHPTNPEFEMRTIYVNWDDFVLAALSYQRQAYCEAAAVIPELQDHPDWSQEYYNILEREAILMDSLQKR